MRALRFSWKPQIYSHAYLACATSLQGYSRWLSMKRLLGFILEHKDSCALLLIIRIALLVRNSASNALQRPYLMSLSEVSFT